MRVAEPQTNDPQLVARYEQHSGLSVQGLGRIVGPQVVGSVALTGSDPYFLTGTDVALVFETTKPELLKTLLLAQIAVKSQKTPSLRKTPERPADFLRRNALAGSTSVVVRRRAARCSAVTNSPYQLERFAAVANKDAPAIASLDEFAFFRNRYRRTEADESALLFLSDATIRRWCGPRWRIATSRKNTRCRRARRVASVYMDKLVKKQIEAGPLHSDLPLVFAGDLTLSPSGVRSAQLGAFEFMNRSRNCSSKK